jgi:hypothetical protein
LPDLARSDAFWEGTVSSGYRIPMYETLGEAVSDAHLIVVGRVTDVREGESYTIEVEGQERPGPRFFYATITIDESLYGEPETRTPGTIDLRLIAGDPSDNTAEYIPDHANLFFLHNDAVLAEENGRPQEEVEYWRYSYGVRGLGGVIRDIDGVARILNDMRDHAPLFPTRLDGDPFEEVVQRVPEQISES